MQNIYFYIVIASLTIASPGPGVILTLTNTLNYNLRNALIGIIGISAGMGVIAIVAASSVGVIITTSPFALIGVKVIGAAYLTYLGIKLFRSAPRQLSSHGTGGVDPLLPSALQRFRQGFFVSLLNPKPIVFFMALFPQFINEEKPFAPQFTLLSLTFCLLVIIIHFIYGFFAYSIKKKMSSGGLFTALNKAGGVVFMCFALGLIVSTLSTFSH